MKTWFIYLGINLVLPVAMLVLGFWLKKVPPQYGSKLGYRTRMSQKNEDTWIHAQECAGTYLSDWGRVMVVVAVGPMLVMLYTLARYMTQLFVIVLVLELIAFLMVFPVTENGLYTIFDEDGNRKISQTPEF